MKAHETTDDGIWCPRCGDMFHDEDIDNSPEDYYECPTCHAVQHEKCRHLMPEEKQMNRQ